MNEKVTIRSRLLRSRATSRNTGIGLCRAVGALVAVILAGWGCGGAVDAPLPPKVTVDQPKRGPVQRFAEFTGTMRAVEFAEIRARVPGILEQMLFEPTAFVNEGDVLFEIERQSYQASLEGAKAQLESAKSELGQAQADLKRIQLAAEARAVSEQDLDEAKTIQNQAHAAVLSARARLDQATIDLEYTRVATPISGQVGRNLVDVGNLVGTGEPTLLTTVTRVQPIHVYFNAPEQSVLRILEAQRDETLEQKQLGRVLVATAIDSGFPHEGKIDFIDNTVNAATGTIEMRAIFENPDRVLFPGLFVRIRALGPAGETAILVDERAVGTDLGGKFVLIVGEENVVARHYITLGPLQDDGTIVVAEGLDGTERYIVNGMLRARPGLPVTPQTRAEADAEKQVVAGESGGD